VSKITTTDPAKNTSSENSSSNKDALSNGSAYSLDNTIIDTLEGHRVLVTGGAGYIGSHTVLELLEQGYNVTIVDNLSNSSPLAVERVSLLAKAASPKSLELKSSRLEFFNLDVRNENDIEKLFSARSFKTVIHFAGLKAVGESTEQPILYFQNNVSGTISLLNVMRHHSVKQLIFSSSATVYGEASLPPFVENASLSTTNPYGKSKLLVEEICREITTYEKGWKIALLRYFNPVGAHASGMIGEDPQGVPNNLLPFAMQVAVGLRPTLTVFGNDYPTPDGTCVRDYIHVTDLAKGHVAAIEYLNNTPYESGLSVCEAINLGTGYGSSVTEVINAISLVLGKPLPFVVGPRRNGDAALSFADASKANKLLGWRATLDLNKMCQDSWLWQQKNPFGYSAGN
jgi:UDP-glucose 4-epimerase